MPQPLPHGCGSVLKQSLETGAATCRGFDVGDPPGEWIFVHKRVIGTKSRRLKASGQVRGSIAWSCFGSWSFRGNLVEEFGEERGGLVMRERYSARRRAPGTPRQPRGNSRGKLWRRWTVRITGIRRGRFGQMQRPDVLPAARLVQADPPRLKAYLMTTTLADTAASLKEETPSRSGVVMPCAAGIAAPLFAGEPQAGLEYPLVSGFCKRGGNFGGGGFLGFVGDAEE